MNLQKKSSAKYTYIQVDGVCVRNLKGTSVLFRLQSSEVTLQRAHVYVFICTRLLMLNCAFG